jgi:Putative Flp pilus-assembly TadE/G-like
MRSRWRSSSKAARRDERGVTLVFMTLMLFLALGMGALAVDYGMIKASKAEAQRAVDAAALAGASAFLIPDPLIDKVAEAEARAREYAGKHAVHRIGITNPQIEVDLTRPDTITVTYTGPQMPLWFAQTIGIPTMGISAAATARAYETSNASCIMPVALPDLWQNNDITGPKPEEPEERGTPDQLWSYEDLNSNGWMDPGTGNTVERELWEFDLGIDVYDADNDGQGDIGYGTDARNNYAVGNDFLHKVNDYGRQIMLMNLSPKDGTVSSNYYAWGYNTNDANSGSVLHDKIADVSCEVATVGTEYPAAAGNGATAGQISPAWDTRIGYDQDAFWDDVTNRVEDSDFPDRDRDGLPDSPRVVIVALYDPENEMTGPSDNTLQFNNFAKIWVDQRPPGCSGASCKNAITGRFLGFVGGRGGGGGSTGSLIKTVQLIK